MVLVGVLFSGCQKNETKNVHLKDVFLESDVFELIYSDLYKAVNKTGKVENVTVKWLFRNMVNRTVKANITVEFYDNNDNLVFSDSTHKIELGPNMKESYVLESNKVSYNGKYAAKVKYVVIKAFEANR